MTRDAPKAASKFDPRITPVRADLAAAHLKGSITRETYVHPTHQQVCAAYVSVRKSPDIACGIETQIVYGRNFDVYDESDGWAWGQEVIEGGAGYVGYVPSTALRKDRLTPQYSITVLRAPVFLDADLKTPVRLSLPLNARIHITEMRGAYAHIDGLGYIHALHISPIKRLCGDYISAAEAHLGLPYIWGGVSSDGLDCSGLVQSSLRAIGKDAPRDADMQEAILGTKLSQDAPLKRGDLVFWKGHVGILQDADTLLHANAHHMSVASEPLAKAIERIGETVGPVTSIRRL